MRAYREAIHVFESSPLKTVQDERVAWFRAQKPLGQMLRKWVPGKSPDQSINKCLNALSSQSKEQGLIFCNTSWLNVREATSVVRVQPENQDVLLNISYSSNLDENNKYTQAILYLQRTKDGWSVQRLLTQKGVTDELPWPTSAVRVGDQLLIGTASWWMSNSPKVSAELLRLTPGGWRCEQHLMPKFECWQIDRFSKNGKLWERSVSGYAYPKNVSVAHVAANIEMKARFVWKPGGVVHVVETRIATAYAAFDDLIGAVKRGDRETTRRLCSTKKLADRIMTVRKDLSEHPNAGPAGSTSFTLHDIGLECHFKKVDGVWKLFRLTQ
ncbi:MAG: hypothetical protein KF784_11695 [Fimbriimonadaceae bacterium]|nr:hypothetical protein [Fimbriimonadaceae bacterium]